MFPRFRILTLLSLAALAGSAFSQPAPSTQQAPAREITPRGGLKLYKKMQTIKPGMTREQC